MKTRVGKAVGVGMRRGGLVGAGAQEAEEFLCWRALVSGAGEADGQAALGPQRPECQQYARGEAPSSASVELCSWPLTRPRRSAPP